MPVAEESLTKHATLVGMRDVLWLLDKVPATKIQDVEEGQARLDQHHPLDVKAAYLSLGGISRFEYGKDRKERAEIDQRIARIRDADKEWRSEHGWSPKKAQSKKAKKSFLDKEES